MGLSRRNNNLKILIISTALRIFISVLFVSFIVRCSPEVSNKTLRFFFDGVPTLDTLEEALVSDTSSFSDTLSDTRLDPHKTTKFFHAPYREKQCSDCHNQRLMGKLVEPQPALCYQCHEDFGEVYEIQHGPVAGGYCTACHSPHFANDSTLLIRTGQDLCLFCHKPGEGYDAELHDGIEDTDCTECHNPHGADNRELLK